MRPASRCFRWKSWLRWYPPPERVWRAEAAPNNEPRRTCGVRLDRFNQRDEKGDLTGRDAKHPFNEFGLELGDLKTDTELRLWLQLKNRNLGGFKFRRQHPIPPYIVDFVCLEQKLIVELDGGQHAEQTARDAERAACLESKGFRIIRFWNDDALKQTDAKDGDS